MYVSYNVSEYGFIRWCTQTLLCSTMSNRFTNNTMHTLSSVMYMQSCQPLRFLRNHYDFLFFITLLRPYSENYDKSAFSRNSFMWYSSDTVLAAHCITRLACLYFGEYTQVVACSAQPLWCSSYGSCSRPHRLFPGGPSFCGGDVFHLCMISSLLYNVS